MSKAAICIISILLIVGCATAPKAERQYDSALEGIQFYTQMLIELTEAVNILSDESLSIEDRLWLYKAKIDLIEAKTKAFEAKHLN